MSDPAAPTHDLCAATTGQTAQKDDSIRSGDTPTVSGRRLTLEERSSRVLPAMPLPAPLPSRSFRQVVVTLTTTLALGLIGVAYYVLLRP
jgi:hypothetical protein